MKFIKKINNYTLPYATSQYDESSEPLWADGAGRETLDGSFVGMKIGNFSKLVVEFPSMPNSVLTHLKRECKKEKVTLEWYSTAEEQYIISDFYPGSVKSSVLMVLGSMIIMKPFSMEFTAIRRE